MASAREVNTPNWNNAGKQTRDYALTTVSLSNLQELLDSQANAASCLQLAYLSTSSIPDVQNGIRNAAMRLWSADADAITTMGLSAATATSVMQALPDVFELLKSPETLPFAQDMLNDMAREAHKIQARFTEVAAQYMKCSSMLSDNLNKGNVARADLQKKVEDAKALAASAEVFAQSNQQAVEAYDNQLRDLKKQQEDLDKKEDDIIKKQYALELTKAIMGGFTDMLTKAGEAFITVGNPTLVLGSQALGGVIGGGGSKTGGAASGDAASSGLKIPFTSDPTANREVHVKLLADATAKMKELENKLEKMGDDATAEKKAEVTSDLNKCKDSMHQEMLIINEMTHRINAAGSDDADPEHHSDGWDLARNIEERAKVVQERQRDAEARRAEAQGSVIKYQAQLAALAQQAQFDEPHLDQIKTALENLAKASTSVQALAVFWQSIRSLLDTMASKSEDVSKPNFLGALVQLTPAAFALVVNTRVTNGLIEIYGYWWAVKDICNAYKSAASNVMDVSSGRSMYTWTRAAPNSAEMKELLTDAVAKAKAGKPIIQAPDMPKVEFISRAA